jgi:hypothetical protein
VGANQITGGIAVKTELYFEKWIANIGADKSFWC